jgi:ATP-dependent Clp protease ATP-binding subunit ClpC
VQLAAQLGHDHVGTGHVLLGLLREDQDLAGQLLGGLGVTYEKVLAQMRRRRRTTETVPPGPGWPLVPSTPGALRVPDIARQQAAHNGSRGHVGTQHYLLALTVPGSLAAKTLASFGITYEALKERCAEIGVAGSSDAPDAQRQPR